MQYLCLLAALATSIVAHGNITSPPARQPGPAMLAACGRAAVASAVSDPTNPLEDIDMSNATPKCKLDLCRGATFADNMALVQSYTPGQVVRMQAILPIPHEGPMNVSIIDAKTNTVMGGPLIEFASYADEKLAKLPPNNTDFSVTMPTDSAVAQKCAVQGACVMQWFWVGTKAKQTYESCVDFVMVTDTAAAGTASSVPVSAAARGISFRA